MRVFLIHGMGRSPWSFALLQKKLSEAGYIPSTFGYFVSRDSFDAIAQKFIAHIEAEVSFGEQYAIIGHSLGGVLTRYVAERLPKGFSRFVMLAPPNRSPRAAQKLKSNALFRALTGDSGQKLADEVFYKSLPTPKVPTLVFRGASKISSPFYARGEMGDIVLSVAETHLEGATQIEVSSIHTFIMNNPDVLRAILDFLRPSTTPT